MKSKFLKKFTHQVVSCPSCYQKLRVPARPGKTLEIKCQKCGYVFQINFKSPLDGPFQYNRNQNPLQNLKGFMTRYTRLPIQGKRVIRIFLIFFLFMIFMLAGRYAFENSSRFDRVSPDESSSVIEVL
ncbi:MAG: hypothetical protein ACPGJV_08715 [Bacteriovoracaceae bacterium]